jgi:hypothetical protein
MTFEQQVLVQKRRPSNALALRKPPLRRTANALLRWKPTIALAPLNRFRF